MLCFPWRALRTYGKYTYKLQILRQSLLKVYAYILTQPMAYKWASLVAQW